MSPPEISVVIVNYNGRHWLEGCLTAVLADPSTTLGAGPSTELRARAGDEVEVVLVDNASTDGSAAFVRERFPQVRLVTLETNRGFAGGNNAGLRVARGQLIALLNNDTVPQPGWLWALKRALDDHPEAGLATARIVFMDEPGIVDSAGDGYTRSGGAFKHAHGRPSSDAQESREVFGACGAACMIRRAVLEELDGFDEDFFAAFEDVDVSYRAQLRDHRCLYVADAIVHHAGSASLGRLSPQAIFYSQRNLEWVYFKNTPAPLLIRSLPGHVLYDVAAAGYFLLVGSLGVFLRAKWAALRGAPAIWRKRRTVQRHRTTNVRRLWALMEPRWLALKIREERFDLASRNQARAAARPPQIVAAGKPKGLPYDDPGPE